MENNKCILNTDFLPPLKGLRLKQQYASIECRPLKDDGYKIRSLKNVTLSPRGFIANASENPMPERIIEDCDLCTDITEATEVKSHERVMYCGYFQSKWGHFLLNSISRLWYMLFDSRFDKYLFFTTDDGPDSITGNYLEFFELLGIADRVELHKGPVTCQEVVIPELGLSFPFTYSAEYIDLIKVVKKAAIAKTKGETATKGNPIFLTRSNLPKSSRYEIGINMLDDFFASNGFSIISPEKLTLSQLITSIESAPIVASVAGSTAHNLIFGNATQQSYIMERTPYFNFGQPLISKAIGSETTYIETCLSPSTAAYGLGPFMYYPTEWFKQFSVKKSMPFDFSDYISEKVVNNNLRKYFRACESNYGRKQIFEGWLDNQAEIYARSARYTTEVLSPLLMPTLWQKIKGRLLKALFTWM